MVVPSLQAPHQHAAPQPLHSGSGADRCRQDHPAVHGGISVQLAGADGRVAQRARPGTTRASPASL